MSDEEQQQCDVKALQRALLKRARSEVEKDQSLRLAMEKVQRLKMENKRLEKQAVTANEQLSGFEQRMGTLRARNKQMDLQHRQVKYSLESKVAHLENELKQRVQQIRCLTALCNIQKHVSDETTESPAMPEMKAPVSMGNPVGKRAGARGEDQGFDPALNDGRSMKYWQRAAALESDSGAAHRPASARSCPSNQQRSRIRSPQWHHTGCTACEWS